MKRVYTKYTKYLAMVPAVIILAALILNLLGGGINPGIDFTGGSIIEYAINEQFESEDISDILTSCGYEGFSVSKVANAEGEMTNVQVRLKVEDEDTSEDIKACVLAVCENAGLIFALDGEGEGDYEGMYMYVFDGLYDSDALSDGVKDALDESYVAYSEVHAVELDNDDTNQTVVYVLNSEAGFGARRVLDSAITEKYVNAEYVSMEHAGAVSSGELIKNALLSIAAALVLMLIYIAIRFDLYSGIAALFGLFHDVMIMLAAMSFFGKTYQINSPFIAALLTIVGYSINDTIIIFDRIRENKKRLVDVSNIEIVETSVRQSVSRTINTSITTLITLVALYVLGVSSIKEFTFPLIAGMLAGAYSSNLLNGPLWAWLLTKHENKAAARNK